MASISFPEVSESMHADSFTCWVLWNPVTKKFYGATTGDVNYGWTDTPQVVCEGCSYIIPQTKATAERILSKVLWRYRKFTDEEEELLYPGQKDLQVVQIRYWRDGTKWEFVE